MCRTKHTLPMKDGMDQSITTSFCGGNEIIRQGRIGFTLIAARITPKRAPLFFFFSPVVINDLSTPLPHCRHRVLPLLVRSPLGGRKALIYGRRLFGSTNCNKNPQCALRAGLGTSCDPAGSGWTTSIPVPTSRHPDIPNPAGTAALRQHPLLEMREQHRLPATPEPRNLEIKPMGARWDVPEAPRASPAPSRHPWNPIPSCSQPELGLTPRTGTKPQCSRNRDSREQIPAPPSQKRVNCWEEKC